MCEYVQLPIEILVLRIQLHIVSGYTYLNEPIEYGTTHGAIANGERYTLALILICGLNPFVALRERYTPCSEIASDSSQGCIRINGNFTKPYGNKTGAT